jgi:ATP diphosphatase
VGFDWPDHRGVLAKLREELDELDEALASGEPTAIEHEYGDALMALANLGRHIGTPPEAALRRANDRFASRFGTMEHIARDRDLDLQALRPDELEGLWEEAKAAEGSTAS